jgi:hypothetical protein
MSLKTISKKLLFLFLLTSTIISCEDQIFETYVANVPVYMSFDEFRSAIQKETARDLEKPGKIYFYNNYLFINEYMEGIHIINNTNPSAPVNAGFIKIPGNIDISIKDDILYADSYIDIVAIDITDLNNISVTSRLENLFPYTIPPFDENYRVDQIDQSKGIVVGWELKKITREVFQNRYPVYPMFESMDIYSNGSSGHSSGASSFGVGGSMARFTCKNDALYAINMYSIMVINIENYNDIHVFKTIYSGWNIETLFPSGNNLFVGTQNGMLIYDITNELNPEYISQYWHITSCDPVVVKGDYAYVTLRSGNLCGETSDRLDVIDISNLTEPELIKSYSMSEPYGLGIDNNTLFICDGDAGLKIYDATDPLTITDNLIKQFSDIQAYDVIPLNGVLMLIGEDGFYQYDYSDLNNIQLLSTIAVMN